MKNLILAIVVIFSAISANASGIDTIVEGTAAGAATGAAIGATAGATAVGFGTGAGVAGTSGLFAVGGAAGTAGGALMGASIVTGPFAIAAAVGTASVSGAGNFGTALANAKHNPEYAQKVVERDAILREAVRKTIFFWK